MQMSFRDVRNKLNTEYGIEFETCPVGGHNIHGKVERKIQHVKSSMSKHLDNLNKALCCPMGDFR